VHTPISTLKLIVAIRGRVRAEVHKAASGSAQHHKGIFPTIRRSNEATGQAIEEGESW